MLLGPAESSELSVMVTPTDPSSPVLSTSDGCRRMPTVTGKDWLSRSIVTWPLATLTCPISAAIAGAATKAAMTHNISVLRRSCEEGMSTPENVGFAHCIGHRFPGRVNLPPVPCTQRYPV